MRLEVTLLHFLDLRGKHDFSGSGRINTVGLNGDDEVTTVLEEVFGVQYTDTLER